MLDNSDYNEISDLGIGRHHVVILGAGASLASFPNGDRNGRRLPLMNDLMTVCGLLSVLKEFEIVTNETNFEVPYSELHEAGKAELLTELGDRISSYFSSMELTDGPTIYDLLVISLREKDLIATFNWDPFLWQALERNHSWISIPKAAFLHGNVAVGYCPNDWIMGGRRTHCPKCKQPLEQTPLLYPIKKKGYQDNQFISSEWSKLRVYLESAYMITVFGYSAPASDAEAIRLMKDAYNAPGVRGLEQIEIIDVKAEDALRQTWSQFIVNQHYQVSDNFYDSWIANHPRRTCDTMWQQLMEGVFLDPHQLPITGDWKVLRDWFRPLIDAESAHHQE